MSLFFAIFWIVMGTLSLVSYHVSGYNYLPVEAIGEFSMATAAFMRWYA